MRSFDDIEEMKIVGADITDECFTVENIGHFNVTLLRAACEHAVASGHLAVITAPIDDATKRYVKSGKLDVDKKHLDSLTVEQCSEKPCVLLLMSDGTCQIADGIHTLTKLVDAGEGFYKAWIVPEAVWRTCMIQFIADGKEISPKEYLDQAWGRYAGKDGTFYEDKTAKRV